jgi:hypothetical protein
MGGSSSQLGQVRRCRRTAIAAGFDQGNRPIEEEKPMTVSTTVRSPIWLRRGPLAALAAGAAVAGIVTASVAFGGGDGTKTQSNPPSKAAVLSTLTPEQRQYVEWVSSAPPEQVAAAFGTYRARKAQPVLHPGADAR